MIDHLSHSSLSLFNFSPNLFYKTYITKEIPKRETDALKLGAAIDTFVFDIDNFNNKYYYSDIPTMDNKMGIFIKEYVNGKSLEEAYQISEFKYSFDTVCESFKKVENQEYYKTLMDSKGRIILSKEQYNKVLNCSHNLLSGEFTKHIYLNNENKEYQKKIEFEYNGYKFISVLDELEKISDKEAIIRDLKTTGKPLEQFKESFYEYGYHRQGWLYTKASNSIGYENIKYQLVVIETTVPYRSYVYEVSNDTLNKGKEEINKLIYDLNWHIENDKWLYKRNYYEDKVITI